MAKKKRGGKRTGAGRPSHPDGKTVVVTASVPEVLVKKLDTIADRNEWNRSQAVTEAIRDFVSDDKS